MGQDAIKVRENTMKSLITVVQILNTVNNL